LELVIRRRGYRRVFVPEYICPVVFDKLKELGIESCVYQVTANLEIRDPAPRLRRTDALLYVNYYGLKNAYCDLLARSTNRLILDLTQAFLYTPPADVDAFNSARKFVGVPDGGYVFGDFVKTLNLTRAVSWCHCEQLLRRLDGDIAGGYPVFKASEKALGTQAPLRMSVLTERLLHGIDFEQVRRQRIANQQCLQRALGGLNLFPMPKLDADAALCYPLLVPNGAKLKHQLIERDVYVPTFWPDLTSYVRPSAAVQRLAENLVCLPVDQRYSVGQMELLATECLRLIKGRAGRSVRRRKS
jgi:hypothetical protein